MFRFTSFLSLERGSGLRSHAASAGGLAAVAAGGSHSLALKRNGTVTAWGLNTYGQTNVPAGLSNVMAVAAGWAHTVALKNDGTLVGWGNNSDGQCNAPTWMADVKLLTAGGNQTAASVFSPLAQYPVHVSKDLLLIYNTNSLDSSNVCAYYLAHRPMVSNANVLGIGCVTNETAYPAEFTNQIVGSLSAWLQTNPTKRPQYAILFLDIPSRVNTNRAPTIYDQSTNARSPSVSYQLHTNWTGWQPFITHINMNGTNACKAYVDKLSNFGSQYTLGELILSPSQGGYGNTHFYFEDAQRTNRYLGQSASSVVLGTGWPSNLVTYASWSQPHIWAATNVCGYFTWGYNAYMGSAWVTNGVRFYGQSSWYLAATGESYSGVRTNWLTEQPVFLEWFSSGALGGSNYANTPVGGVTHVDEPYEGGISAIDIYFRLWAAGKPFGTCAWNSRNTVYYQAVGNPLVRR